MPKNYDEVQEWIDNMVKKAAELDEQYYKEFGKYPNHGELDEWLNNNKSD